MRIWRVTVAGSASVRAEVLVEATCKSDAEAVARRTALHRDVHFEVEPEDDLRPVSVEKLSRHEVEQLKAESGPPKRES
jgi:hypothetical protein